MSRLAHLRRIGAPALLVAMLGSGALGLGWMSGACAPRPAPTSAPTDDVIEALAAALQRDITHLSVTIGERHLDGYAPALTAAAAWIEAELVAAGWSPTRECYPVEGAEVCNVYVEIVGSSAPDEIVVIGAHYDSAQGTPGADDNASGVAALLYLAREARAIKPARTLRLVCFTNEEPPHFKTDAMGSLVHARKIAASGRRVTAMISLEMLGYYDPTPGAQRYPMGLGLIYPSHGDYIAVVGDTTSEPLVAQVALALRGHSDMQVETLAAPQALEEISFSDQWSFWQQGWPGIMITDTAFLRNHHYHQTSDVPARLDVVRMARVVRGLPAVAQALTR